MFKTTVIENEKQLQCCLKHNQPIIQVILNPQLSKEQRLLCVKCLDDIYIEGKSVGFKKIIEIIQEQQQQKMDQLENIIMTKIREIEQFEGQVIQLKSNLIAKLDQLLFIIKDWIKALQSTGQRYSKYSFYEELETLINNYNNGKFISQNWINDVRIKQLELKGLTQIGVFQLISRI